MVTIVIKNMILFILTYITNYKIVNKKLYFHINQINKIILLILFSFVCGVIKYKTNFIMNIIAMILMLSVFFDKEDFKNSIMVSVISLGLNYIIIIISIIFGFIMYKIIGISNDYLYFYIMIIVNIFIWSMVLNIKKIKYGFSFYNKKNEYMDLYILFVCIIVVFFIVLLDNSDGKFAINLVSGIIMIGLIISVIIPKLTQFYYQQKQQIKEIETLNKQNNEYKFKINEQDAEILSYKQDKHTIVHKQEALEFKVNEIIEKYKIDEEDELKEMIKDIRKYLYKNPVQIDLTKTEIPNIDNMLKYQQSECIKNNIEFELQLNGNIHKMINNYVAKEELEILLADHIKDAIIAINHSDNINRSILVRLGIIDNFYSLYIYDTGIEFKKETLRKLGKEPASTYLDEGGTGMGFMNTFNTLKKYKASLIINEIGKPCKENYTKIIKIIFDEKDEFKVESYR